MTNPTNTADDNKARAFFTTALTIGAGFAGLAVAGLVLGIDYLLHGEPHERESLAQRRADDRANRYADAVAWLENDRRERERARTAKREWFEADPTTRGDAPSADETIGRVLGRLWNNLIVGKHRFKKGWQQGRDAARQRRDNGDQGWWKRPQQDRPHPAPQQDSDPVEPPPAPKQAPRRAPVQPPANDQDDIHDAEIVPDPEPTAPGVVPATVGDPVDQPDPAMDEYQRRINNLGQEVAATSNGLAAAQPPHSTSRN